MGCKGGIILLTHFLSFTISISPKNSSSLIPFSFESFLLENQLVKKFSRNQFK